LVEEPEIAPTTSEAVDSTITGSFDERSAGFDDFSREELFFLPLSDDLADFVDFYEDLSDPVTEERFF
jgi:hypothetical protein